jgi:hypothetical protein
MKVRTLVADNVAYAFLGGPALALLVYAVCAFYWGSSVGLGFATVTYLLGWVQAVRQPGSDERLHSEQTSESDDETSQTEKELSVLWPPGGS